MEGFQFVYHQPQPLYFSPVPSFSFPSSTTSTSTPSSTSFSSFSSSPYFFLEVDPVLPSLPPLSISPLLSRPTTSSISSSFSTSSPTPPSPSREVVTSFSFTTTSPSSSPYPSSSPSSWKKEKNERKYSQKEEKKKLKQLKLKKKRQNERDKIKFEKLKRKQDRFRWTEELHQLFLLGIREVGWKEASPNSILQIMKRERKEVSVTREQVSSHLQKFKDKVSRGVEVPPGEGSPGPFAEEVDFAVSETIPETPSSSQTFTYFSPASYHLTPVTTIRPPSPPTPSPFSKYSDADFSLLAQPSSPLSFRPSVPTSYYLEAELPSALPPTEVLLSSSHSETSHLTLDHLPAPLPPASYFSEEKPAPLPSSKGSYVVHLNWNPQNRGSGVNQCSCQCNSHNRRL